MQALGINGICRASFYVYTTVDEIDRLIEAIGAVRRLLRL
ncbi:MAG: hypothetical protein AB7N91_19900 [Candidatus Tectimicrobiota bacterium]